MRISFENWSSERLALERQSLFNRDVPQKRCEQFPKTITYWPEGYVLIWKHVSCWSCLSKFWQLQTVYRHETWVLFCISRHRFLCSIKSFSGRDRRSAFWKHPIGFHRYFVNYIYALALVLHICCPCSRWRKAFGGKFLGVWRLQPHSSSQGLQRPLPRS